tara:strand:+ start:1926 stop:2729 length:804 start_codon:yes stop_codon:yes gene_type:complete
MLPLPGTIFEPNADPTDITEKVENKITLKGKVYTQGGGSTFSNNDYFIHKSSNNLQYCVMFVEPNISAEDFYYKQLLSFNNLPPDNNASLNHFNKIQNWFILNYTFLKNGNFLKFIQQFETNANILLLAGWGKGAKDLWKYLLLNKLPIMLLDPSIDEKGLEYFKTMSTKQKNMTIINSNSDNWTSNKQTQRLLKIIENNYQNFDNSLIKQPGYNGLNATHNLIGQPLFNNNIIIKAYDAVLNTTYYRDRVKRFDLADDRYIRRYNN